MKILHVYKRYSSPALGGIEKVIDQLINGMSEHGVESSVLSIAEPGQEVLSANNIYQEKQLFELASTPFSLKAFSRYIELARQADVIHYHFPWPFADILHIYGKMVAHLKKPTVLTYHSDIVKQKYLNLLYKPCMNYFLNDMDCIVASTPNYLKSSPILPKYQSKIKIIPIGLDKDSYPIPSEDKYKYWSSRFGNKFILFIGVMRYYKGLQYLIEAARDIDVPIVIAGPDGKYGNELKALVSRLNLTNVHFLGPVSEEDKSALFQTCYCVVLPSQLRSEAFGISLLEGAMFGKPLVTTEINTGTTYINIHEETGVVVPPADSKALSQALRYLLDHPQQAQMMGVKAQERFSEIFTGQKMLQSYIDVYKNITHQKS